MDSVTPAPPVELSGRIHLTISKAIVNGRLTKQENRGDKPKGLWYGIDDSWWEWCALEGVHAWIKDKRICRLHIDTSDILFLRSVEDIDRFTSEWGIRGHNYYDLNYDLNYVWDIRWADLAIVYKGIEIAPYFWERRLHEITKWYYTWDCASGCIWDLSAVTSVEPLWQPPAEVVSVMDDSFEGIHHGERHAQGRVLHG